MYYRKNILIKKKIKESEKRRKPEKSIWLERDILSFLLFSTLSHLTP